MSPLPRERRLWMPSPLRRKVVSVCVPAGILSFALPLSVSTSISSPEDCLGDADGQDTGYVVPIALEVGVGPDVDDDVEVAGLGAVHSRLALAVDAQLHALSTPAGIFTVILRT